MTIQPFAGDRAAIDALLRTCAEADGADVPLYLEDSGPAGGGVTTFSTMSNGTLIGVAHLPHDPVPEACLAVHPAHRRRGVGRALLAAVRAEAGRRGLHRFIVVSNAASAPGAAFLVAAGARFDFAEFRLTLDCTRIDRPAPIPGLSLRRAEPDEVETIIAIRAAAFDEDPVETRASVLRRLDEPGRRYFLGVLDGTPVGLLRTGDWEGGADITSFGVLPEQQGKGYGRRMLLAAIDTLLHEGYESVTIEVATDNDHALGLYRSCGFQVIAKYDYYAMAP